MRLAHLILAHAYPKQLQRLISRLQHPETDIYIQLDGKSNMRNFSFLAEMEGVRFIKKRSKVMWGTYSLVRATLDAMEEILATDINYSHINLLSGTCYPIRSAEYIYRYLIDNRDKTFMESHTIGGEWEEGRHRIENYNFGDYLFPGHYLLQYLMKFSRIKKKKPSYLNLYGRSQWLTITPECASYVIEYIKSTPEARRFFRMSFAPDEFVFQTVLYSSPLQNKLVKDNLRYVDFPKGYYHPRTLTVADAIAITTSGKLFARKFDPDVDQVVLNYLDWIADFNVNINDEEFKHIKYIFAA